MDGWIDKKKDRWVDRRRTERKEGGREESRRIDG